MLHPHTLVRHAVCLGMTGSGKTGFCLAVIEDLARAGVPVLALDPKGDLGNLRLVFPDLDPDDFLPWVDEAEARRRGLTPRQLAERTAAAWREGLAASGLGPADLAAFRERVEVRVLTPGSETAPVDVLGALTRCPQGLRADPEGLRGWVTGAVGALLDLVGRPANPLTDPAAVLLATLMHDAFAAGEDLPFDVLLPRVVDPPFPRLGLFPVDDVMPRKARTALAHDLNHLVASPAFGAWRTGEPLDLDAWTAPVDGRTPVRVLALSHLGDAERMFFVTLFLHAVVAWTRRLPGVGDLRALVYFDEVAGYLPPHPKDPPSKAPALTLMKQARSVGVGMMLATQNPVDVDHKAMSNAGTWIVGKLLTENDRDRVLEGMLALGGGVDRRDLAARIASLPSRHFVVRDAEGRLGVMRSRHTLCYLRGPLTRHELARLLPPVERTTPEDPWLRAPPPAPVPLRPGWLDPEAAARLLDVVSEPLPDGRTLWRPALYARMHLRFDERDFVVRRAVHRLVFPLDGPEVRPREVDPRGALRDEAPEGGAYAPLPGWIDQAGEVRAWVGRLVAAVLRDEIVPRLWHEPSGRGARADETRAAFEARLAEEGERLPHRVVEVPVGLERDDVVLEDLRLVWIPGEARRAMPTRNAGTNVGMV